MISSVASVVLIDAGLTQVIVAAIIVVCVVLVVKSLFGLRFSHPALSRIANAGTTYTQGIKTPRGLTLLHVIGVSPAGTMRAKAESMYMIELPFVTTVHLVGVPAGRRGQILGVHAAMEPVVLEGDYPQYFQLYTNMGGQVNSRYVLDPKAMVFTIDFVKDYYWEIHDNALFLIGDEVLPAPDVIDQFVAEIRPAVEEPNLNHRNPGKLSYTERGLRAASCPLCGKVLVGSEQWLECPDGHGCLVTGKQMILLRKLTANEVRELPLRPQVNSDRMERPSELPCAYCYTVMKPAVFPGTNVEVDICPRCGYRWFDGHELFGVLDAAKQTK